jgi:hypothetical protein
MIPEYLDVEGYRSQGDDRFYFFQGISLPLIDGYSEVWIFELDRTIDNEERKVIMAIIKETVIKDGKAGVGGVV